jgi:hypothetical protein
MFVLIKCSLQFAKAGSAATLSQQEESNSVDVQRGGFVYSVESWPSRRCTFGEF